MEVLSICAHYISPALPKYNTGIVVRTGRAFIHHSLFYSNYAGSRGGAIYTFSPVDVHQATMIGNVAGTSGGATACSASGVSNPLFSSTTNHYTVFNNEAPLHANVDCTNCSECICAPVNPGFNPASNNGAVLVFVCISIECKTLTAELQVCTECQQGFDIATGCTTCLPGLDLNTVCQQCIQRLKNPATQCRTCTNPLLDAKIDCGLCIDPRRDVLTGCTTCTDDARDPSKDCEFSFVLLSNDNSEHGSSSSAGGLNAKMLVVIVTYTIIVILFAGSSAAYIWIWLKRRAEERHRPSSTRHKAVA